MAEPVAPSEKLVPAVAPDGSPIMVPASQAAEVQPAGGHVMSQAEEAAARHEIDLQNRYGTGLGTVEGIVGPTLAGAARDLSYGLSDQALVGLGDVFGGRQGREAVRRRLADYQDFNPAEGMVGGMAALAMAGGLPGTGGINHALEKGAAGLLGEGSALARVGGRALGGALSGAAEGAIYSAGKTASDAAIQDEPLTGEKLVAGATHGALFGGGLGAAMGLGAGVLNEGARGVSNLISGLRAPRSAEGVGGAAAPRGSIADQLSKEADAQTLKAMGASKGDIQRMNRAIDGGAESVGRRIRQDMEAQGKSIGHYDSAEAIHEYASTRYDQLVEKQQGMLRKLDESGGGIAPSPRDFIEKARQELVTPNLVIKRGVATSANDTAATYLPGTKEKVEAVEKWLGDIQDAFSERSPTFKEWFDIRRNLAEKASFESLNKNPVAASLQRLTGLMNGELEAAGEAAAASKGGAFRDAWKENQSLLQAVIKAKDLSARGMAGEASRNTVGLRSAMGLIGGIAAGNPLAGVMMGLAGKVIQDRGNMLAADLLGRVATVAGASRIANRVSGELQKGVGALVPTKTAAKDAAALAPPSRATATPMGVSLSGNRRKDYAAISGAIASAVSNPIATSDRVSKSLGDLGDHAPKTAQAAINTTLTGLNYLAGKLPPSRQDSFSLQPQFQKGTRASDAEISQFMRYAQAVDDPLIVLREAKTGTLTRDHVDAVKNVYPNLYAEMQTTVMRYVVDSKQELPYDRRVQLGILLDIPTDKSLSPAFMRAIQATYSDAEKAGAESPPSTSVAPQIAGSVQTATQGAVERAE